MLGIVRSDLEPVRIVEAAGVNADDIGPTFEAEKDLGAAIAAAIWAREIGAVSRCRSPLTYLCGLLHDIGGLLARLRNNFV